MRGDGRVLAKGRLRLFHILCSDGSRTSCLLWSYIALEGFGCFLVSWQCPSISDSLCANSRTLDIGKAQEAALQQTEGTVGCGGERCLGLFWEWVAWYDGGNEKRRAAYVSGSGEAGVV